MRFISLNTLTVALLTFTSTPSLAHPQPAGAVVEAAPLEQRDASIFVDMRDLWKRKGGGGGGGKGGGSSSSGSSSSGSSSGSSGSSGSSSSGGSRGTPIGAASGSSNAGGRTRQGSGVQPSYGGGRYYGGGATQPFQAGKSSPRGIVPVAAGAGLLLFPGLLLYGAYAYPYSHSYSYYNRTARRNRTATSTTTSATATSTPPTKRSLVERFFDIEMRQESDTGVNETKPVTCVCADYAVCGCDDEGDTSFLDSIIGDGDYTKLNASLVQVADVDGKSTIVLDGTLPNGTTGSGGTEDATSSSTSLFRSSGYFVLVAVVGFTCFLV